MRLTHQRSTPHGLPTSERRLSRVAVRFKKKPDGKVVRLRRVRRKKTSQNREALASQAHLGGGNRRANTTSELQRPAPVQSKTNSVGAKKPRFRCHTPGLGSLVKRTPSCWGTESFLM